MIFQVFAGAFDEGEGFVFLVGFAVELEERLEGFADDELEVGIGTFIDGVVFLFEEDADLIGVAEDIVGTDKCGEGFGDVRGIGVGFEVFGEGGGLILLRISGRFRRWTRRGRRRGQRGR